MNKCFSWLVLQLTRVLTAIYSTAKPFVVTQ